MSLMKAIGDWHEKLMDRALNQEEGESDFAHYARCFLAGAMDGWSFSCLIWGNFFCLLGLFMLITGKNKTED